MRRQRSISLYAENEQEFIEEYDKKKSISERRRLRSQSYSQNNEESDNEYLNSTFRQKFFESYDDLELDQLGVNSTFQIAFENSDSEDENKLIKKIKNINLSFKQKKRNSFWTNVTELSKNIICSNLPNKNNIKLLRTKSSGLILKNKNFNNNENFDNDDEISDCDDDNLGADKNRKYHMSFKFQDRRKRKFNQKYDIDNDDDENELSFKMDNNQEKEKENEQNKINIIKEDENNKINKNNLNNEKIDRHVHKINTINVTSLPKSEIKIDEKKLERRYTLDLNMLGNTCNNKDDEDDGDDEKIDSNQNRKLQDFISNNDFLSKNVDFVDEHLKFLITGNDTISKHLLVNELLNNKKDINEIDYERFNIYKKVIKLLGDYIKLELYEEDCSMVNSMMLKAYINLVDAVFMIVNLKIKNSSNYILDLIEKIKYKINEDQRHFTVILICFDFINNDENDGKNDVILENKKIIENIEKNYDIKPNYIKFDLKNDKNLRNKSFVTVINKYWSLVYLKKERKNKIRMNKCNKIRKSTFL